MHEFFCVFFYDKIKGETRFLSQKHDEQEHQQQQQQQYIDAHRRVQCAQ